MRKITGIGVVSIHERGGLPADQVYDEDAEAIIRLATQLKSKWLRRPQNIDETWVWRYLERGPSAAREFLRPDEVWAYIFKSSLEKLRAVCQKTKTPIWQVVAALEGDLAGYVDEYILRGDFLVHACDGRFLSFMTPVVRNQREVRMFADQENREMLDYLKGHEINTLVIVGRYLGYSAKRNECTMCMNLAITDAMKYGFNVIVPSTGWVGSNPVSNRGHVEQIRVPKKEKVVKVPTWIKVMDIKDVCEIIKRYAPEE